MADSWFSQADPLHTLFVKLQDPHGERKPTVTLTTRPQLLVLVVDDSQEVRSRLRALIDQEPLLRLVGAAPTAAGAVNLFLHYRPDLVLLSISLPDASGFRVLDCIKGTCPHTIVILMTRFPNPCVEESGLLLGAAEVCPKTANFDQIRGALTRFIQMRFS